MFQQYNLPIEIIAKIAESDIDAAKSLCALGQQWEDYYEKLRVKFLAENTMYNVLESKNKNLLQKILKHGADPNKIFEHDGGTISTPLVYMLNFDSDSYLNIDIIQILLENKADPHLEYSYSINDDLICNINPLIKCIYFDFFNVTDYIFTDCLLDYYDTNSISFIDLWRNFDDISPSEIFTMDLVEIVLTHGVELVRDYDEEDAELYPFLEELVGGEYYDIITYLVEHQYVSVETLVFYLQYFYHIRIR